MIDPQNITNFNRTEKELQEFLLFCICVAGKQSKIQAPKLDLFLHELRGAYNLRFNRHPFDHFEALRELGREEIQFLLKRVAMGQHSRIAVAMHQLACDNPPLKTITLEGLQRINGIGPKTARFFLLHSFKGARCAVLDTHILKHLANWNVPNVPKSTPQNMKEYMRLEQAFLKFADESGLTPADYDLALWKQYAK